jgi:acyl-CoA synthetase (AMP-forming)/AMP-acid ligase II
MTLVIQGLSIIEMILEYTHAYLKCFILRIILVTLKTYYYSNLKIRSIKIMLDIKAFSITFMGFCIYLR